MRILLRNRLLEMVEALKKKLEMDFDDAVKHV